VATLAEPRPAPHQPAEISPGHWSESRLGDADLAHIPGDAGPPVIGNLFRMLKDPHRFHWGMFRKYGPVYKNKTIGHWHVMLIGAEANEMLLFDRDKNFSSEQGWGPTLHRLFPRGLMLLDFDKHRADRRALSIAFKPEPMRHYADALDRGIAAEVAKWNGTMLFYPAIKQLTLELAADSFIGVPWGPESAKINQAFVDMVQASITPVRKPLPFTQMRKGVKGRAYLVDYFTEQTLKRRAGEGLGQDMFSQFATATGDDGKMLPVDEVVDHMNFLMMAAHDTITSSATSLVWLLAKHPEWQEKVRQEVFAVTGGPDVRGTPRGATYDDLPKFDLLEMAFKESLRLIAPVPSIPRRALRSFKFKGVRIPAGTACGFNVHLTHHMEEYWDSPETFDPMRFTPDKVKARHKFAWVPFGGGAHMCLGLHFAYMQVKILMAQMLQRYRVEVEDGYEPEWQPWPIPKPKDGLRITLTPL
jgi:cytochrome P450